MDGQVGGYARVGFSKKDFYNYIDKQRHSKIVDGDSTTTISYLEEKADSDLMMFVRYMYTDEGRLKNLFWVDGLSHVDY